MTGVIPEAAQVLQAEGAWCLPQVLANVAASAVVRKGGMR